MMTSMTVSLQILWQVLEVSPECGAKTA